MNVIFLDIDGVLNSFNYLYNYNHHKQKINYNKSNINKISKQLLDLDIEKIYLLKEIIEETDSYIVITSAWRLLDIYPFIEEYLNNLRLRIIDKTKYLNSNRGAEIKDYLINHPDITNYVIIDDDIFDDFDEELKSHLIHTDFKTGLIDDYKPDIKYILKR